MERAQATRAAGDGAGPIWLDLPAAASCGLGHEPFRFRHGLSDHEAFTAEAVAELCDAAPRAWIANHDADRELVTPRGTLINDDRPLGDVVRGLDRTCNWLVVHHLEHVSPYKGLLNAVIDEAAGTVDPGEGQMLDRGATVFTGSPGAIVPVHIDRHHNFLLQITGTKEFGVGSFEDAREQAREVARNFGSEPSGSHRMLTRQTLFRLAPGEGVYIPANAFHWVNGGPETSVAFSCAFRTELTERVELAQEFNGFLRRFGVPHRAPTGSARDGLKASVVRARRRMRSRRARGG
jgi:hypothetical protein